ncbi:MAG: HD domain-containing protein [Oxalobacteraceae bacterium]|nr:MAG: HD domain-containing protein [Oxalobacteraceae bacterium]
MVERRSSPLDRAITLAVAAHEGQVDKGGTPYILHPLRVMLRQTEIAHRIVAVLHDVVEDSDVTLDTIRADHGDTIAEAIDALTKREGESYDDFIRRCAMNVIARDVKRTDIEDNLDLSRLSTISDHDQERAHKYRRALALLNDAGQP